MFIVGLTGGIGSGKTTVSEYLKLHGIPVIDADSMARKVVEPEKKAWRAIKKEFGDQVFHPSGELNREALGDLIFDDVEKRKKLNEITHPEIYKEMLWAAFHCLFEGHQFVVMDLPLLYETGNLLGIMHKVIVVTCEESQQIERVIKRGGGINEERAIKRIKAQMSLEHKCSLANLVIDNTGDYEDLKKQVEQVVILLQASNAHWKPRIIALICLALVVAFFVWFSAPASKEF